MSTPAIPNSAGASPAEPEGFAATHGSEIVGEAFNAGFKAALTKVKPEMRCLEVLTVKADAWIEFVKAQSQNGEFSGGRASL